MCDCDVDDQLGEGIISDLNDKIYRKRPAVLNRMLKTHGDKQITKIEVCRVPISKMYRKVMNILTLGKSERELKKLNFDELFHLYLVFHLEGGSVISIEKNQRVNAVMGKKHGEKGECKSTPYNSKTLTQFIESAENRNIPNYYKYSAFKDNCQKYVRDTLMSNGISRFNSFIMQDISKLVPKFIQKTADKLTDIAAVGDTIQKGGSKHKKTNPWLEHVKTVRDKNKGKSYKECLILAKQSYKK